MAERERSLAPPYGGVFVPRAKVMSSDDLRRAVTRIAHEIVEPLARRLAEALAQIEPDMPVPVGSLDVAFYRDDIGLRPVLPEAVTDVPGDLVGKTVVLVDDVLFTGRTVRAALNALADYGRAKSVQLAVMVDRGHRELPIRPDYVGKNLPTRRDEQVDVSDDGVVLGDVVPR